MGGEFENAIMRDEVGAYCKRDILSMEFHGHGFEEFFERHTW
jgi:hypothetical protein